MFLEDYEVLNRMNYNLGPNVTSYKTQLKLSDGIYYHLHSTICDQATVKKIKERINLQHPNLLEFVDLCEDETGSVHFLTEFCNRGNLSVVLETCKQKNKYLREEFVCKILQQILSTLKTIDNFSGNLNLDEIFLDNDFNIKLFNLNLTLQKAIKYKSIKVYQVAGLIFTLCSQKVWKTEKQELEMTKLEALQYSPSFLSLLNVMIKDNSYLYKSIDKIMCNSVLLLKSSQWKKDKTFFTLTELDNLQKIQENESSDSYYQKIKLLRIREIALQAKEEKLNEKEQQLIRREKKLILLEKQVKEKLTRAEIYLKQNKVNRCNNENLDSSCAADCGESVINAKTTKKLDLNEIKPPNFMRSKSERKIKFKGHSPLKKTNYDKRRSIRRSVILPPNLPKNYVLDQDTIISEEYATTSTSSGSNKSSKKLFLNNDVEDSKNVVENNKNAEYKPITWTEESKRYAFDMLRIMNGDVQMDKCNNFVKHTVL